MHEELKKFYSSVAQARRIDNSFAKEDDEELTQEEIAAIDAFWGKYSFAYPEIDYKSFKTFKNRYGSFDVRHCPGAIRTKYFSQYFVDANYSTALQNKGFLPLLFHDIKQPQMVLCRMSNTLLDQNYNPLNRNQALERIQRVLDEGKSIIVKCSGLGGGRGIAFINPGDSEAAIKEILFSRFSGRTFVVQEFLKQSAFMNRFNPDTVNTMRITSLLYKGKVHVLAALIRVGKPGNRVDNFSQGGSIVGVDIETGKCNHWALTHDNERITKLYHGLDLSEELTIPHFEEVKATIIKCHYRIPYIKMVSWDFAMDEENAPVLIENNFAGMIQMHEAVTGPLFGDLMEELLDTYLLEKFCFPIETEEWRGEEYHDHIILTEYLGHQSTVDIPQTIAGKPVSKIRSGAFKTPKT